MNDIKSAYSTVRAILHVATNHSWCRCFLQTGSLEGCHWLDGAPPPPFHMLSGFRKVELRMANGRKGDFFFFLIRSNPSLCRNTLQETFSLLCPNRCMRSGCWVFMNGTNWLLHSGIAVHKSLNEFIKSKDDNQSLELPTFLKIKFCSLSSF